MRNNKGFTLVELLVAMAVLAIVMVEVFTVMSNSSKLYLRGSQEVQLQAEAQEIILQLEDLLVDCQGVSVNHIDSISSDKTITISANGGTSYTVTYNKNPGDGTDFNTLSLSMSQNGTPVMTNIPIGGYVGSISLDMATNYSTNDIVTLYITMMNERYTYTTSQDIFLRNQPGTGTHKRGRQSNGSSGAEFDVRRYGSYDLKNQCCLEDIAEFEATHGTGYTYTFEFDSSCSSTADSDGFYVNKYFDLSSSGTIKNTSYANVSYDKEFGYEVEYLVDCYAVQGTNKTLVTQVKVYTQKVSVGLGKSIGSNGSSPYGYGVMFPWGSDSSKYMSPIGIQGIDMKQCTSADFDIDVVASNGHRQTWRSGTISDINLSSADMNVSSSQMCIGNFVDRNGTQFNSISGIGNDSLWVDACGIRTDSLGECLLVDHTRILNTEKYYKLVGVGSIVDLHVECSFGTSGNTSTLEFSIFTVPNSSTITSSSSAEDINKLQQAQDDAWDIINAIM